MGRTLGENATMKYVTIINNQQFEIEIEKDGSLLVNGKPHSIDFLQLGGLNSSLYSVITDSKSLEIVIEEEDNLIDVLMLGRLYEAQVLDERAMLMATRKGGLGVESGDVPSPYARLNCEGECRSWTKRHARRHGYYPRIHEDAE